MIRNSVTWSPASRKRWRLKCRTFLQLHQALKSTLQSKQHSSIAFLSHNLRGFSNFCRQKSWEIERSPSQLLRKLKSLAKDSVKEDVLKNIWTSRLPSDVQKILTVSEGGLDSLAKIADQLMELYPSVPSISSASTSALTELQAQIANLTQQVSALTTNKRGRSRSYSKSRSRSRSKSKDKGSNDFCWYHRTFGTKARRCNKPCSFQENEQMSQ